METWLPPSLGQEIDKMDLGYPVMSDNKEVIKDYWVVQKELETYLEKLSQAKHRAIQIPHQDHN